MKKGFHNRLMVILAFLSFLLLPALAFLQYKWLGELSEHEKDHLKRDIESLTYQYSLTVTNVFISLQNNFAVEENCSSQQELCSVITNNYNKWSTNTYSDLLKRVILVDCTNPNEIMIFDKNGHALARRSDFEKNTTNLEYICNISNKAFFSLANKIHGNFDYLIVPLLAGKNELLLIELNRDYIINNLLPAHLISCFKNDNNLDVTIAITNEKDSLIYSNDSSINSGKEGWYDVKLQFGMLPPTFSWHQKQIKNDKHSEGFHLWNKHCLTDVDTNSIIANHSINNSDGNTLRQEFKSMTLYCGYKTGVLETEVQKIRKRNLIISFSILLLLAFFNVFIIYMSSRAKKLVNKEMIFIGGISHELRTPMTVIRTASENISDGIIDSSKIQSYGKLIRDEVDKLWDMIEVTLSYAEISSNKQVFNFKDINIKAIVDKAVALTLKAKIGEGVNIINNVKADLPLIYADETSMTNAFQSLLWNAIKFNSTNPTIEIFSTLDSQSKSVTISVKDNGIGISKKDIKHIFDPFFRCNSAPQESSIHGYGIGLALVKRILEVHNARITVQSKLLKGSIFSVIFQLNKHENKDTVDRR